MPNEPGSTSAKERQIQQHEKPDEKIIDLAAFAFKATTMSICSLLGEIEGGMRGSSEIVKEYYAFLYYSIGDNISPGTIVHALENLLDEPGFSEYPVESKWHDAEQYVCGDVEEITVEIIDFLRQDKKYDEFKGVLL